MLLPLVKIINSKSKQNMMVILMVEFFFVCVSTSYSQTERMKSLVSSKQHKKIAKPRRSKGRNAVDQWDIIESKVEYKFVQEGGKFE